MCVLIKFSMIELKKYDNSIGMCGVQVMCFSVYNTIWPAVLVLCSAKGEAT